MRFYYFSYGYLVKFVAIWYSLWPFGKFYGYFGLFLSLWYAAPRNIWQPGTVVAFYKWQKFFFFFIRPRFEWSPLFNDGRQKLFLERLKVEDCSSARDQCYENIFAEKIWLNLRGWLAWILLFVPKNW
jgi:hypothetical protein